MFFSDLRPELLKLLYDPEHSIVSDAYNELELKTGINREQVNLQILANSYLLFSLSTVLLQFFRFSCLLDNTLCYWQIWSVWLIRQPQCLTESALIILQRTSCGWAFGSFSEVWPFLSSTNTSFIAGFRPTGFWRRYVQLFVIFNLKVFRYFCSTSVRLRLKELCYSETSWSLPLINWTSFLSLWHNRLFELPCEQKRK